MRGDLLIIVTNFPLAPDIKDVDRDIMAARNAAFPSHGLMPGL